MRLLVLVEGDGFRADFGNGNVTTGFLANRAIDARDVDAIDKEALFSRVREELLANNVSVTKDSRMWISRVSERVKADRATYAGFSFYEQGGPVAHSLRRLWAWLTSRVGM